jgi:membrane protease YdiL (CAAX protease family)
LAVTFGFSWGLWALMIASQRGLLPFQFPTNWSGSFGPALGAAVAVAWSEGRPGLRRLFGRFLRWRAKSAYWLVALFGILAAYGAALLAFTVATGGFPSMSPFRKWTELLVYIPIILVIGGPLGEELGWRGFLQPHLQRRMAPLWAALLVGAVWTAWHMPLVWLEGSAQKGASMVGFALAVLPLAVVFAWLFNRSGGSLLLPLAFHTSINSVSYLVEPEVLGPLKDDHVMSNCFIGALWMGAVLVTFLDRRRFLAACVGEGAGENPHDERAPVG